MHWEIAKDFFDSRRHVILFRVLLVSNIWSHESRQISPKVPGWFSKLISRMPVLWVKPAAMATAPSDWMRLPSRFSIVIEELWGRACASKATSASVMPQFCRLRSVTVVFVVSACASKPQYSCAFMPKSALPLKLTDVSDGSLRPTSSMTTFGVFAPKLGIVR
jgi:hypothetical protein